MKEYFILFCFLFTCFFLKGQLTFSSEQLSLGNITEAYEIKGDIILKNSGEKKLFLMRADADKGLKVFATKKTLLPNDTCLLIISFIPESKGKFNKRIELITSDKATPYQLNLTGNLAQLKTDDKLACFYFGNRKNRNVKINTEPIVVTESKTPRDVSNRMPDNSSEPIVTYTPDVEEEIKKNLPNENPEGLSILEYKPNNILFLVDVSNSMKDSLKLPLMKTALHILINAMRDIDKITFVTYADSLKIIQQGVTGSDKKLLHELVNNLTARGLTKGNKAILASQKIVQQHYIAEGNNQILLATDGKFRFYPDDQKKWSLSQQIKPVTLSTVAFGNDKEAMNNLKEISQIGGGSFVHIKKSTFSEKLLEEIKFRSKRN
jgi:hypothetical protein